LESREPRAEIANGNPLGGLLGGSCEAENEGYGTEIASGCQAELTRGTAAHRGSRTT
jgi:hypothetical protein